MPRHERTVFREVVPGLEQVGRDLHAAVIPLPEHRHSGTEICWLARGEVAWVLGRRRLRLVGGTVSVVGPGLAHRGELDVIAPSDLCWAVLRPAELVPRPEPEVLRCLSAPRAWAASDPGPVGELFAGILAECAAGRPGWRAAVSARAALLAVECARLASGRSRGSGTETPGPVAAALRMLAADLERPPPARELARAAGLGPSRFHALFRQSIGMTPREYLARLRLAAARRELAAGCADITALALRLGFPSSQHFATVFKRHTGLSPSVYRAEASGVTRRS